MGTAKPYQVRANVTTGHLAQAHFGDGTVSMAYTYLARDWLTSTVTTHQGIDVYQTALRYFDGVAPETEKLYDGTITEIVEQYGASLPAPYVLSHITHRYVYDALYQLIHNETDFWDQATDTRTASRAYTYDRNGHRRTEQRNDPPFEDGSGNIQWTLEHDLIPNTNQLDEVTKNDAPWIFGTQYDGQGNLTQLRKISPEGNRITQVLAYDDPLKPILPTTIDQTVDRPGVDQEPEWVPVPEDRLHMTVAYNEGGARIRKTLTRYEILSDVVVPRRPETTRYLPSGTENMTEMDAYGRTTRAYLFAGDERIGFKNGQATALYIKDHLGSTKATLNLYLQDEAQARPFETASGELVEPNLASSTAHHWALDGDLKDGVTNADAILNGSGSTYLSGVKDQGLKLDGIGDYLDLGVPTPFTDDPSLFTAALWIRMDADLTATTGTQSILSSRDGTNGGLVLLIESHTNGTASGTLTLYTYQSGGSDFLKTTTGNHFPNDGEWHYLVFNQNGDQGALYLDGHPLVEGTLTAAAPSTTPMKLGANHSGSNQYLPAILDEVTLLDRPMTLGEVQKTYYVSAAALQPSFPEGGLTGFFELDGDTQDAAGIQADGQTTGDPTYGSGVVGDALALDGVDDGVNLGNPAGFGAQVGDFSVSLWVKLGLALNAENSLVPILSNAKNNTGMELQLKLHPDPALNGILYFYTYQGGYTRLWTDAGAFPDDGQWHHIAATHEGSSGKLYLDGVLVEGKTLAAPDDATAPLWLGTDPAGRAWPGAMDQIRLYDRALASHEVLAHFLNADQRYGLWTGDNTLEDASGNHHHGMSLGTESYEQGIKGQALTFNGTNDTLDLGNPSALSQGLTSFSVTAWVKLNKTLGTEDVDHTFMGNKDGTQGGFTIKLEDHTTTAQTGRIKVWCYNGGTTDSLTGTGHHYLADGDWHQIAFTLEGGTGTLYVDGLQIASKTMIAPGDSNNALYLGSHLGSSSHWIGAVDEIQFYRRGLQAEEIQSDYLTWAPASHRNPQEDPGLTAQWYFDNNYQNQKDTQNPAVPSASLSFVEGKQNDALQLDGTATVDLGTTPDLTLDNGTITLWAKLESPLGTSNGRYVLLANHDADSGFRLIIDNDTDPTQAGSIQLTTYTATTTTALTSGSIHWPNDTTWHHLAVTKNGPTANMYLDGVLIATTDTLDTPDPVTYPLNIGATGAGANYPWAGTIDQVKIYTTALTPFAILGTYLEGQPDLNEAVAERALGALDFQLVASDTDPYGLQNREIYDPTITEREPHGFTGQEKEPDLGLIYYGGRWYRLDIGRFDQADPAREFWNSYSYVGNNPIRFIDPSGEETYAAGRDLNGIFVGTHQFIIIIPDDPSKFDQKVLAKYGAPALQALGKDKNGNDIMGLVVGAHNEDGNLELKFNETADLTAVKEYFGGASKKGFDYSSEVRKVDREKGVSDEQFIHKVLESASNFDLNSKVSPLKYPSFLKQFNGPKNSNAWVQSLLKYARGKNLKRDFFGFDPGHGTDIPKERFQPPKSKKESEKSKL